jgi:predicted methyltransferase
MLSNLPMKCLITLMAEVCQIVNSRPIAGIPLDTDFVTPLTPSTLQSERINLTSPRKATKRRKALMKLDEDISLMISICMARMTKQVKITAHLFN